ncbi:MAG: hypothetical protein QME58_10825 [Bacteroidota bacterium]|nr:hypothetical protein [Bacteroidota bacterium]
MKQFIIFCIAVFVLIPYTNSCKRSPTEPVEKDTARITPLKPNIYIYPEAKTDLFVSLKFPVGGSVTVSEPPYQNGWNITVEPSGRINDAYDYLFYESENPDLCQYKSGWVVKHTDLASFFTDNMLATGFSQREINDFLDYWIPILNSHPFYIIYPQYKSDIEKMIQLEFSHQPDNILRLFYTIKGSIDGEINLPEPLIPIFSRSGFSVAEWGVILK